jgi:hypothetical protein
LDAQRESAFAALEGLTDSQLWHRPALKEWSIGEILDHNYLLIGSFLPMIRWMWKLAGWYGRLRRNRPYKTEIGPYRDPKFHQWVGFIWTRYNAQAVSLEQLNPNWILHAYQSSTKAKRKTCSGISIFMIPCSVGAI